MHDSQLKLVGLGKVSRLQDYGASVVQPDEAAFLKLAVVEELELRSYIAHLSRQVQVLCLLEGPLIDSEDLRLEIDVLRLIRGMGEILQ